MGIRDTIAAFPKPGTFITVSVEQLGPVPVKVLDGLAAEEISKKPDPVLETIRATIFDEQGSPLFGSVAEIKTHALAVQNGLLKACNKINDLKLEDAAKKDLPIPTA